METSREELPDVFQVSERPLPLCAWKADEDAGGLQAVEDEVRGLVRQLSEARFALGEQEKRAAEDVRRMLLAVIEVLDAFQRVFAGIEAKQDEVNPQMKKWVGNFRAVSRQLRAVLIDRDVTEIDNLDQGFDPRWHKIVETVQDPSRPDGTIVEEVQKGYLWRGEVLRKTDVVVVRNEEVRS
jgi:molecular chaperone GrpE (heat shock protein)